MSILFFKQIILLCIITTLPLPAVGANTLFDKFLMYTGVSATPSKMKGNSNEGNLWLIKIDELKTSVPTAITDEGIYHSPLWIPHSDKILAVKEENELVELNIDGSMEKTLHTFKNRITLIGFHKQDASSLLILQNSSPAVLSLSSGQITFFPYDEKNSVDRDAVDRLMSDSRDYGNIKLFIEKQSVNDASGHQKNFNKIHINSNKGNTVISCPANCAQPALSENGRRLVFVGP